MEEETAARQASESKLTAAARLADLGYWEIDVAGNQVSWSEESCQLLGLPATERTRTWDDFIELVHADDRPVLEACRARILRGEPGSSRVAFRLASAGAGVRYAEAAGEAVRDRNGRTIRTVGAVQDVSARKRADEVLRDNQQSQKMQAVGQLATGIAHDFNNLLIVIGGYADLVAKELGPSHRSRRDLDEIRAATRSAATLTRRLLAFSRRQNLQPQMLDLNHILRRRQNMLGRVMGEHITLTMNLSATGRVSADPGQIDQVILNLAVNARDAMPDGGRLLIETADAGSRVMLAVSDTGAGMDEATRARIFEPFFTTKPAGRGTGLGLATVYSIVRQSAGSIEVDSEAGKGTTFTILLPVASPATR